MGRWFLARVFLVLLVLLNAGVSGALAESGISGRVVRPDGVGIENVVIYVVGSKPFRSGHSDANGFYSVSGLQAGTYRVMFDGKWAGYVSEWYDDAESATATPVEVSPSAVTTGINAVLELGGAISGRIERADGVGISGVWGAVYDETNNFVESGITDADGRYHIGSLRTGSYRVSFDGSALGYFDRWYSSGTDFSTATPVTVTAPAETGGIDTVLIPGGSLSGRVTNVMGEAIAGVTVALFDETNNFVDGNTTDANGNYRIGGLRTGSYRIHIQGASEGYLDRWYGSGTDFSTATPVAVEKSADTGGIDIILTRGGTLSGRVTDTSGAGLPGMTVRLYDAYGYGYEYSYISVAQTGDDGSYNFTGLKGGRYKVNFAVSSAGYIDAWYNGASSFATATTVTVVDEAATTGINAVLARGGSISGRVTDSSGTPLHFIFVSAEHPWSSGGMGYQAKTDSDGRYSIIALPTGSYRIGFSGYGDQYVGEWYNDTTDADYATLVAVTAPAETTGIDAVLTGQGSIVGRVTDAAGNGIGGVQVRTYDATHYDGWVFTPYRAVTNPDGSYAIGGLREGSYKVRFDASNSGYLDQWYGGATNYGAAATVVVAPAGIRDNVDAVLVPGGKVTGTVADANGAPLAGVSVFVRSATSSYVWNSSSPAVTDGTGAYTLFGLRSGSYLLYFHGPETHLGIWYGGTSDSSTAKAVSVTAPGTTAGVDVVLGEGGVGDRGGAIAGYAANVSGEFDGVGISVYDESMGVVQRSHENGSYSIGPLTSGRYKVLCEQTYPHYLRRWYGDSLDFSGAATVTVTAPETTTGIDCRLGAGATIRGRVTGPNGDGLEYVRVEVHGASATLAAGIETDGDGHFEVTGLLAGSYRLMFRDVSDIRLDRVRTTPDAPKSFLATWYGGGSFAAAVPVTVTAAGTVDGVDVVMAPGGTIAGRATDASGKGFGGAHVEAYDGDERIISYGITLADGSYRVEGLPSGTFRLVFRNEEHATVWYGGAADFAAATPVAVTAPGTVSVADTAMTAASGGISGLVTDTAGLPVRSHVVVLDANETFVGSGTCDQDGYYQVTGLPTGRYRVVFDATNDGYVKSFFSNAVSAVGATPVQVTASAMTTGINAVLAGGGSISGRVANGRAEVVIFDGSGVEIDRMPTDESGYYRVFGVPSGSYRVFFKPLSPIAGYMPAAGQWYGGKGTFAAADPVTVVAPADTPNVNATQGMGPFITATSLTLDFGTVFTDGAARRSVRVGNYGTADITVGTVGTLGGNAGEFTVEYDSCSGRKLKAADECVVEVGFSPAGTGARSALLAIPSDAVNAPNLSLTLAGTGEAPPALRLAIAGTGTGSVNSDPAGIACTVGTCSASFPAGEKVLLMAAPGSDSRFAGWSGDCSPPRNSGGGLPSCEATMDRDRSVTATFELQALVKVLGLSPHYYSLIAGACGAVPVGGSPTVLIQDHEFGENLVFSRNQAVRLRGGYSEGFTTSSGMTTIRGSVTIVNGSLDLDRVIIK